MQKLYFRWRYWRGKTPWDTNVTPPEVVQFVGEQKFSHGHALDLGCGTGTNAIYLARHGFRVVGVDFVPRAIEQARAKARSGDTGVEFRCADVLNPGPFAVPFDFMLDIGCLHNLAPNEQSRYAQNAQAWTRPGSVLLVYAFFPYRRGGRHGGITRETMVALFESDFDLIQYADDAKSAWYRWERKGARETDE